VAMRGASSLLIWSRTRFPSRIWGISEDDIVS
jgi:hypothetical protein